MAQVLQAYKPDIKVFEALGIPSVSVITSITVQNTLGIQEFFDLPSNIIEAQIEALVNDTQAKILKLGMIRNVNVLKGHLWYDFQI